MRRFLLTLAFFLTINKANAELLANQYDEFYGDINYETSINSNLQTSGINQYAGIIPPHLVSNTESYTQTMENNTINSQYQDIVNAQPISQILGTNSGMDGLTSISKASADSAPAPEGGILDSITATAKNIATDFTSNVLSGASSFANTAGNALQSAGGGFFQQPIIIGGGTTSTDTGTGTGKGTGTGGTGTGTGTGGTGTGTGGTGTGGTGTGGTGTGGTGTGGTGGTGTGDTTCRSLTQTQRSARLVQLASLIAASPTNVSLVYEKGMLLFCNGDYKNAGLELAKMHTISPSQTQSLLSDVDNALIIDRFSSVLTNYKASPLNPEIMVMANKVKAGIEQKNQLTEEYFSELNKGYAYNKSEPLNYEAEVDKIYKMYRSQNLLQSDLATIYGTEAATEIMNSRNNTQGSYNN